MTETNQKWVDNRIEEIANNFCQSAGCTDAMKNHSDCCLSRAIDDLVSEIVEKIVPDDDTDDKIGTDCHDKAHDIRWCQTCESRLDGIDAYKTVILDNARALGIEVDKLQNK